MTTKQTFKASDYKLTDPKFVKIVTPAACAKCKHDIDVGQTAVWLRSTKRPASTALLHMPCYTDVGGTVAPPERVVSKISDFVVPPNPLAGLTDEQLRTELKRREDERKELAHRKLVERGERVVKCVTPEVINAFAPEHDRTSCSDTNRSHNGFWALSSGEEPRCTRCTLLDLHHDQVSGESLVDEGIIPVLKFERLNP